MQRLVLVLCALLLFVPVIVKSRKDRAVPELAAFLPYTGAKIMVKVNGEVRHPGIYTVSANTLARSVINLAEPVVPLKLDTVTPLARPMRTGESIVYSSLPDGQQRITVGFMTVPERIILGIPLDMAAMTEADFDRLPGIGPALARRIVGYRQKNGGFMRVEDLSAVEGIGEKKYALIRKYF